MWLEANGRYGAFFDTRHTSQFLNQMNFNFVLYSATGNIIGVAYYPEFFDMNDFMRDRNLWRRLKDTAMENKCDSVMILAKSEESPFLRTVVFEPNAGGEGAFSTMCGNGVRAVAAYAREYLKYSAWPLHLRTESGVLEIEKTGNRSYSVRMGFAVSDKASLRRYVNTLYFSKCSTLLDVPIPPDLMRKIDTLSFGPAGPVCSIGFTTAETNADKADGEPHMVIELDGRLVTTVAELKKVTQKYGPFICSNQGIFPLGMNVNFVVSQEDNKGSFRVCTFERNLGDTEKSVTQACGTGATFAGAEQMRRSNSSKAVAECLGGKLQIGERDGALYLSGSAVRV